MESVAVALWSVSNTELGVLLLRCVFGWGLGFMCFNVCKRQGKQSKDPHQQEVVLVLHV